MNINIGIIEKTILKIADAVNGFINSLLMNSGMNVPRIPNKILKKMLLLDIFFPKITNKIEGNKAIWKE